MPKPVVHPAAAESAVALAHFEQRLRFETDCWDTHQGLLEQEHLPEPGFVLLDVRSPALYIKSHLPGAINLPHGKVINGKLTAWPLETLFVVYCAGPHCNGANRAAIALAKLGRPVKEMIGGVTGWADEGFVFAIGEEPGSVAELEREQL